MKNKTLHILIILLLLTCEFVSAQSARSYFKDGRDLFEQQKFDEAIVNLTKAIEMKPDYEKAILQRAQAYEQTKENKLASDDYMTLCTLDSNEEEYYFSAGQNLFKIADYTGCTKYLHHYIKLEDKNSAAYEVLYTAHFELKEFNQAKEMMDWLIEAAPNKVDYYTMRATALDSAGSYIQAAADYDKRLSFRDDQGVFVSYAKMLHRAEKFDDAKIVADRGIAKFPKTMSLYFIRADAYVHKLDFPNAINDLSRVTVLDNNNIDAYKKRADAYRGFNQFQSAIGDYGKIISLDPQCYEAYFNRAKTFEDVSDVKSAVSDYKVILQSKSSTSEAEKKMRRIASERLFELQRETTAPLVTIKSPESKDGTISLAETKEELLLQGVITDASDIKTLVIGNQNVEFVNNNVQGKVSFSAKIRVGTQTNLEIIATDIYDNVGRLNVRIKRNEVNAPEIQLLSPFASENGEVFLESESTNLNIEGTILDESFIQKVTVNGINASFSPSKVNPKFTAIISIRGIENIEIAATDIYGNITTKAIHLNRDAALAMASNPMGKTWLVFIENSNYETFASLEGPQKDVTMMKEAMADYQLHNIIHKKDMTKKEMERFFSIELRDLIRSNHVNSLLVWYAGHGKYLNETGYWIPVDAQRDDEFTYFNIGNLKAGMQSYSKDITHTLVITDACESGPSFYQAMRSTLTEKTCDDPQATRFKSSQVFSSAGYELASDNSQFTKTFAKALQVNSNSCLPIEKIVLTVTQAAKGNNQQQPQFGKIYGMEDENGTFFFMKK